MIPMDIYPGLEGLPAILGKSLYTIQADGSLLPSTAFNKRFERELTSFALNYAQDPGAYTLGTILPVFPKPVQLPWTQSATLHLTPRTLNHLRTLEMALDELEPVTASDQAVEEEMSAYQGMRRLNTYGLALGYQPAIGFDAEGNPMVVNLHPTGNESQYRTFHRYLQSLSQGTALGSRNESQQVLWRRVSHLVAGAELH